MTGLQEFAQLGAERVLNSIPAGLLIAALAWLLVRMLPSRNSGTRFAVWFSALLAIAAVPFVPVLSTPRSIADAAHPKLMLPISWAFAIAAAWMLIAVFAIARVAVGLWKLRSMRRNAVAISTSDLHPTLQATVTDFQSIRLVALCTSSDVRVPTAIGFFNPAILIPEWALRELSTDELKVILLHEFAHLRRWDDWTNLTQKLVRTIFFFHPAVWWIEKRLSLEREMACDDVVLAETKNPRAYAECLVSLAEKSFVRRGLAMAQAVIGHARETSQRLAQILDVNRPSATSVSRPALSLVAIFGALSLVILPDMPKLIAFESPTPAPVFASADVEPRLPQGAIVPAVAQVENHPVVNADYHVGKRRVSTVPAFLPLTKQVGAKRKQSNPPQPQLVRTAVQQPTPMPQFLFVMQTTQFDGRGSARVSFSVWQITFTPADGNTVPATVIVKSI
jgi:beta-lactamase regulating signal transducer with metallopeptidase domain